MIIFGIDDIFKPNYEIEQPMRMVVEKIENNTLKVTEHSLHGCMRMSYGYVFASHNFVPASDMLLCECGGKSFW